MGIEDLGRKIASDFALDTLNNPILADRIEGPPAEAISFLGRNTNAASSASSSSAQNVAASNAKGGKTKVSPTQNPPTGSPSGGGTTAPPKAPSTGSSSGGAGGGKPPRRPRPTPAGSPGPPGTPRGPYGVNVAGMTEDEISSFFARYKNIENWITERIQAFDSPQMKALSEGGINLKAMIDALSYEDRKIALNNFRNIFQFDQMLGSQDEIRAFIEGGAIPSSLSEVGKNVGGRRVFKFGVIDEMAGATQLPSGGGMRRRNPLVSILNNMSIQYDEPLARQLLEKMQAGENVDLRGAFKFGGNIMQADYVRGLDQTLTNAMAMPRGHNILVFDTETLGLNAGNGNIRQLSAMNVMSDGIGGFDEVLDPINEYFETAHAQVGMISNMDKNGLRTSKPLMEYLSDLAGSNKVVANKGSGDEFVEAIKPTLRRMRDAEYIMGHNVQFDLDQLLTGARMTSQYLNSGDQELIDLVDEITERVKGGTGVLDTLHIAKNKLPGLGTAAELAFAGEKTTHSLENIMLQTNLIDRMVEEAGGGGAGRAQVMDFLGMTESGAMHQADVDTKLTAKLYQFLTDQTGLEEKTLGGKIPGVSMAGEEIDFYGRVRTFVRRSYAPIPVANIADIRDIDPRLFDAMLGEEIEKKEGRVRFGMLDDQKSLVDELELTRGQGDVYSLARRGAQGSSGQTVFSGTSSELLEMMSRDIEPLYAKMSITPLEQEVFLTRNLVKPLQDLQVTEDTFFSMGNFRRVTGVDQPYGGLINKVGTFFKRGVSLKPGEFSQMQQTMQNMNLPFAGLSMPEAQLTNVMARSTAGLSEVRDVMGPAYSKVANIADDVGISHFVAWDSAKQLRSGKVQLPVEVLRAAGLMGDESGDLLSLSTYSYQSKTTKDTIQGVNLSRTLDEQQIQGLQDFLSAADETAEMSELGGKRLIDYGVTRDVKASILNGLQTHGEYGISIGRVEGQAAREISDVLENNVLAQQINRDTGKIPIRMRMIDMQGGEAAGTKIIRTGPAFLDRFMGAGGEADHVEGLGRARQILDDMVSFADTKAAGPGLLEAATFGVENGTGELGQKIYKGYKTARKASPYALAALAVGAGTYYMGKRQKESNLYSETTDKQDPQDYRAYASYRKEMGMQEAPAKRLPDPLLTSYMVSDLDQNKIGHTKMGVQKYGTLYNGY
jgi:DNA polymerase III epsilon subunit-like protein